MNRREFVQSLLVAASAPRAVIRMSDASQVQGGAGAAETPAPVLW